jgi:hypothetical protein
MIWSPVRTLCRRQWVPRTLHETFEFFERPQNLARITPPWLGFRILTPEPIRMARGLTLDYTVAFQRYLPREEEAALAAAYELGRRALASGISILELAQVHHDILLGVLQETRTEEVRQVAVAASTFFLEALAASDMAQRSFLGDD